MNKKLNTKAIHGGAPTPRHWGESVVPVYQTVSFAYDTAKELGQVFAGRAPGYLYTRIANPTNSVLENRLTELEGGVGCIATSSGMAAIASTATALLRAGDHVVAALGIFGGTVSLFTETLDHFDIHTDFVDIADTQNIARAINDETRMIFVESIGNPRMDIPDLAAIGELAQKAGIPFVVDSTLTTPVLLRPKEFNADIVIHSTTKFINGHGTAMGGAIVDTGRYNWAESPFPKIKQWVQRAGQMAFLAYLRNTVYRDLGACPAPMNSFLMLQGLETLTARMALHCSNAQHLAEFLAAHAHVAWVNYPGLPGSPFYKRIQYQLKGSGGPLLTFGLGSRERAFQFIDALTLAQNLANLGEAKTLVIHPASTIFHEFDADQRSAMGVSDDMVRVSVGIEDPVDITADFQQALEHLKE